MLFFPVAPAGRNYNFPPYSRPALFPTVGTAAMQSNPATLERIDLDHRQHDIRTLFRRFIPLESNRNKTFVFLWLVRVLLEGAATGPSSAGALDRFVPFKWQQAIHTPAHLVVLQGMTSNKISVSPTGLSFRSEGTITGSTLPVAIDCFALSEHDQGIHIPVRLDVPLGMNSNNTSA